MLAELEPGFAGQPDVYAGEVRCAGREVGESGPVMGRGQYAEIHLGEVPSHDSLELRVVLDEEDRVALPPDLRGRA